MLGILPGLIGVMQATETVKIILGKGETLKDACCSTMPWICGSAS